MVKRKIYDWEAIEREYRSGQLSIREIARQYGCGESAIRKKMKKLNITRDLSKQVAEKVRSELVRSESGRNNGRTADPETERSIVNDAAARVVAVVKSHQKRISSGETVVEKLFKQLEEIVDNRKEIEEDIEKETDDDRSEDRRNRMLRAVSIQANASTAVSLSAALKNLIALSREAFSIDEKKSDIIGQTLQDILVVIDGKSKGIPG